MAERREQIALTLCNTRRARHDIPTITSLDVLIDKAREDYLADADAILALPSPALGEVTVHSLNFCKAFWRAQPSCADLDCNADCNPMTTYCGRAAEVFASHPPATPSPGGSE